MRDLHAAHLKCFENCPNRGTRWQIKSNITKGVPVAELKYRANVNTHCGVFNWCLLCNLGYFDRREN